MKQTSGIGQRGQSYGQQQDVPDWQHCLPGYRIQCLIETQPLRYPMLLLRFARILNALFKKKTIFGILSKKEGMIMPDQIFWIISPSSSILTYATKGSKFSFFYFCHLHLIFKAPLHPSVGLRKSVPRVLKLRHQRTQLVLHVLIHLGHKRYSFLHFFRDL